MTGDSSDPVAAPRNQPIAPAVRGLRTPRAAAIAGLAFGVLYILSTYVVSIRPPDDLGVGDFPDWYTKATSNLTIVSLYLAPLAGIAFLWFVAVIRNRIGEREDRFFATVFIGSGLLFVAMLWAAGATIGSLAPVSRTDVVKVPDLATFDLVRSLAHTYFVYATRAASIFVIVTSTIALGTAAFPRWLVGVGYLIALVQLLTAGIFDVAELLFPIWVMILSATILVGDVRLRRA
jgi:hypothetical protein